MDCRAALAMTEKIVIARSAKHDEAIQIREAFKTSDYNKDAIKKD
jgi:hypothetical protein